MHHMWLQPAPVVPTDSSPCSALHSPATISSPDAWRSWMLQLLSPSPYSASNTLASPTETKPSGKPDNNCSLR
eukprot:g3579.t1